MTTRSRGARPGEWRDVNGGSNREWYKRAESVFAQSTVWMPIVLDPTRVEGTTLYDVSGHAYLDLGCVGADNFGFAENLRPMHEAVAKTNAVPMYPQHDVHNIFGICAAEELVARTPVYDPKNNNRGIVFAARSGSDANEVVLDSLIKARPRRPLFGCFEDAFHGRNTGIRSLLDRKRSVRVDSYPVPYGVRRLPFPHNMVSLRPVDMIEWSLTTLLARDRVLLNGFFLEIVQGEGGVNIAHPIAIRLLVKLLREHDVAIIVDEVQTGMARTGTLWAYEQYKILPDFVTMGKSLGGGVQDVNAVVMARRWNFAEPGMRSTTFGLEPNKAQAVRAALAAIDRRGLCDRAQWIGEIIRRELIDRAWKKSGMRFKIRGLGAMFAIQFPTVEERDAVLWRTLAQGLFLQPCGDPQSNPSIRIMPPLVISEHDLRLGLRILAEAIFEKA